MKVSELIKKLRTFPKNYEVLVEGYEDGYDSVKFIESKKVKKYMKAFKKEWYCGDFVETKQQDKKGITAVVILGDRIKDKYKINNPENKND